MFPHYILSNKVVKGKETAILLHKFISITLDEIFNVCIQYMRLDEITICECSIRPYLPPSATLKYLVSNKKKNTIKIYLFHTINILCTCVHVK